MACYLYPLDTGLAPRMSRQIQRSSEKYPDRELLGANRALARVFVVAFLQHDNWV
jgi:hypothetical protein